LATEIARALIAACNESAGGRHLDNFIVALAEDSGGTAINLNFNKVIADRAGQMLGDLLGSFRAVHSMRVTVR
jgi:aspartate ammonia-lyase